jgi:MFS family permease
MAPLIAKEWGLSREVLGPSFSSALTGLMVGYLVLSPLSDRFGHPGVGFGFVNVFDVSFFPENRPGRSFFLHLPRRSRTRHSFTPWF